MRGRTPFGRIIPHNPRDGAELAFPGSLEGLVKPGKILVGKEEIALAGGIKAALDEAHSAASLKTTPRVITAYEAVGSNPTEEDGAAAVVQIVVGNEGDLREAIEAGAEAVLLEGVTAEEAGRLEHIGRELRADLKLERG